MDRRMLNIALCALLDELPEEGMPESYVHLVFEQAAVNPPPRNNGNAGWRCAVKGKVAIRRTPHLARLPLQPLLVGAVVRARILAAQVAGGAGLQRGLRL